MSESLDPAQANLPRAAASNSPSKNPEGHTVMQAAGPNLTAPLQVDSNDEASSFNDTDSAIWSDSTSTASASLSSSILDYKYENGRRYHAYREGSYVLPNDEAEQDRMDLHHHVFRLTLDGQLYRAPIPAAPERILDVGTGTGIWAMDFADEFPSAVVVGTDLSPIQPHWVPPNCKFVIDDAESEWLYSPDEAFDYIHGRGLGGSIADWPRFYRQAYAHLKPGGWCEVQEYEAWVRSDDDTINQNGKWILEWQGVVDEASIKFGKRFNVAESQKQYLINAGFVDVRDDVYKVPLGTWPREKKLKELGMYQLEQMVACVESFTLALLTRVMGWSNDKTQVLMAGVKNDFRNRKNHLYVNFHFVYGRKPMHGT